MRIGYWVCFALLVPGAAAATPPAPARQRTLERVVAFVDGEPIWLTDLRRASLTLRRQLDAVPESDRGRIRKDVFEQLLQREIERKLIAKEARSLGVTVSQRDTDVALSAVAKQNGIDVPSLLAAVQKEGMTEAGYRAELAFQVLEGKLIRMRMSRQGTETSSEKASLEGELDRTLKRMEADRKRWLTELRKRSHITIRVQL